MNGISIFVPLIDAQSELGVKRHFRNADFLILPQYYNKRVQTNGPNETDKMDRGSSLALGIQIFSSPDIFPSVYRSSTKQSTIRPCCQI